MKTLIKKLIPKKIKSHFFDKKTFLIDIVDRCNLRCPSCPSGRQYSAHVTEEKSYMTLEHFKLILDKIKSDYGKKVVNISLYNWTEPLLHPDIFEFIKLVNSYGYKSSISTNLNYDIDLDLLVKSNPSSIVISLSGFSQNIYKVGHRGGNIDKVKTNMEKLSKLLQQNKSSTRVAVYYHKYINNLNEVDLMKVYAKELGFSFSSVWAFYIPIESLLDIDNLQDNEKNFIQNNIAFNLKKLMNFIQKNNLSDDCAIQNNTITLNYKGDIQLCCSVNNPKKFTLGNFLDLQRTEYENMINQHSFCKTCKNSGLNVYASWSTYPKVRKYIYKVTKLNNNNGD